MGVAQLLKTAAGLERRGMEHYTAAAERLTDPVLEAVCRSLAADERTHAQMIRQFYEALRKTEGWEPPASALAEPPAARERLEQIMENTAAKIGPDMSYAEVYESARDLEQRSYDFYSSMAEGQSDPALLKFLRFLMNVENVHMEMLDALLEATRQAAET